MIEARAQGKGMQNSLQFGFRSACSEIIDPIRRPFPPRWCQFHNMGYRSDRGHTYSCLVGDEHTRQPLTRSGDGGTNLLPHCLLEIEVPCCALGIITPAECATVGYPRYPSNPVWGSKTLRVMTTDTWRHPSETQPGPAKNQARRRVSALQRCEVTMT